jgi:hypothetical protein
MSEIRIDMLQSHQVAMLNAMWRMESHEEYLAWCETLPAHLKIEAQQLLRILMLEAQEMEMDLFRREEDEFSEANEVLNQFRLKK